MGDEMAHSKKVTDTAIELARMWGVMETLEDIPSMKEVPTNSDDKNKETHVNFLPSLEPFSRFICASALCAICPNHVCFIIHTNV